jgi:hypothetical protein
MSDFNSKSRSKTEWIETANEWTICVLAKKVAISCRLSAIVIYTVHFWITVALPFSAASSVSGTDKHGAIAA